MKLLFLMSDTGGGHRAAAQAIAEGVRRLDPCVDVEVVDAIGDISPAWHAVVRLYGPLVRRAPWAWGLLYAVFRGRGGGTLWRLTSAVVGWTVRRRLFPYVDRKAPDLVCSTHPLINQICLSARARFSRERGRHLPYAVVVTDPVRFHPAWVDARADLTVVATPDAATLAHRCGAPPERVQVLGMPVHPALLDHVALGLDQGRAQARAELGLPVDAPVVLCTAGGDGMGGFAQTVRAVADLPGSPHVLAVAGRDARAQRRLQRLARERPHLHVAGFTSQMLLMMRAADVVVSKAGPGTLFEALALGRPLVITGAVPGQETGNLELVRRHGVGRVALAGPQDAAQAVAELLANPEERAAMARRGVRLARPGAAVEMAGVLLKLAERRRLDPSV